jgi:probable F420-dependent oxidoreductase
MMPETMAQFGVTSPTGRSAQMRFGLVLGMVNPSLWMELAELADESGFDSVWLPEHLVLPVVGSGSPVAGDEHPPISPNIPVRDVFVQLGAIAARTTRIKLGTFVYNIGLRHPFITARAIATLDVISEGRVDFGIGASWLAEEWDAVGLDFASRGARVDESIEVCRRLWSEEVVEHHGRFFDFAPVMFEPKPVQQPLPLLIGGDGRAAMRRVAELGAGWGPMNHTLEALPASLERLQALWEEHGRAGRPEVTMAGSISGDSDLEELRAAGVDRLLVSPWTSTKNAVAGVTEFSRRYLSN